MYFKFFIIQVPQKKKIYLKVYHFNQDFQICEQDNFRNNRIEILPAFSVNISLVDETVFKK